MSNNLRRFVDRCVFLKEKLNYCVSETIFTVNPSGKQQMDCFKCNL